MAVIGIDLGTTNSLVSAWTDEGVRLIPNAFGEYLTPSVVSFSKDEQIYVGKVAKEMLISNPQNTFSEFKRNMGENITYELSGMARKSYRAEELSALVLRQLKQDAECYLGEPVEEAIISVPAYFNDNQRCATRNAGSLAGLKVNRLVNEPSAAALSNSILDDNGNQTFVVFDFGGGTLDISVVDAFENIVEIQAVAGDNKLGGKDFNEVIADYFYTQNFLDKSKITDKMKASIYREAEQCKILLSSQEEVEKIILIDEKEYKMHMSNQLLIHLSKDIFTRMQIPLEKALNSSELEAEDIDKVILVGGSSKMPIVRVFMQTIFDNEIIGDLNPDESIAYGVGVVVGIKSRKDTIRDVILSDICPFTLGVEIYDGSLSPMIERNSILPCSKKKYYVTVHDNQKHFQLPIYQGEALQARKNLLIAKIDLEIPPKKAGEVGVWVVFTYDIDGIFDIDIECMENGVKIHKTILNEKLSLSESELQAKMQELALLKLHPREKEENQLLLAKADRLYEELSSESRVQLHQYYEEFLLALDGNDEIKIREEYVRFSIVMEYLDKNKTKFFHIDDDFWEKIEFNNNFEKSKKDEEES